MLRIKELREDNDLTQKQLADLLNCTQQTYSRYETEEIKIDIYSIIKLAKFYNTSTDYILGITDIREPYRRNKEIININNSFNNNKNTSINFNKNL